MYSVPHRTFAAADGGACTSLAGTCERRVRSWTRASSRKSQKGLQIHDGHAQGSMLGADYPGVSSADNLTWLRAYSHAPTIGQSVLVRARPPLRSPTYPLLTKVIGRSDREIRLCHAVPRTESGRADPQKRDMHGCT